MANATHMDHVISIFVGVSKESLGNSTYYRSNLPAVEVERCHEAGCKAIGIERWRSLREDEFNLTREQGDALRKVSDLNEHMGEDTYDKHHPITIELPWSDVYLAVARHGARQIGLELQTEEIEAGYIDARGEVHGMHQ